MTVSIIRSVSHGFGERASVAQWPERQPRKLLAAGSTPARGSIFLYPSPLFHLRVLAGFPVVFVGLAVFCGFFCVAFATELLEGVRRVVAHACS